jgi:hypothetical protein
VEELLYISSFQITGTNNTERSLLFLTNQTQNFYAVEINDTDLGIVTPVDFRIPDGRFKFSFYDHLFDAYQYIERDTKL